MDTDNYLKFELNENNCEMKFMQDIIYQVLVQKKSKELIYLVLNEFLPKYEKLNPDSVGKPDEEEYEFQSEDEIINYYIETKNVKQTFYWKKYNNNQDRIMVGVNITTDNQMVFSLTFEGTEKTEKYYFLKLKQFLKSEIGVISYFNPVDYYNGEDFKNRYA